MDRPVRPARVLQLRPAADLALLLAGPVVDAARGLLGARLVRERGGARVVGRIVEAEAYAGPEDRASHARSGPTARAATMFGPPGHAYVYGVYGMHICLNVVAGPSGQGAAILLRSVEPLEGLLSMRAARLARAVASRRAVAADPAAEAARLARIPGDRLAAGPANLAAAFGVSLGEDGIDLLDPVGSLRLEPTDAGEDLEVLATARVGVAYAGPDWADRPWRFVVAGTPAARAPR
ncbi:MAG: DNA-3-methyladenine glycosylase [Chloroflexota bacterium]